MAPQVGSSTPATSLREDEEQVSRRMMAKRVKIIAELMQTEKDYISDLDLCIKEVIQPLRNKQVSTGGRGQGSDVKVSSHVLLADNLNVSTRVSPRVAWCQEQVQSQLSGKACASILARRPGSQIRSWHLCCPCTKPASSYLPRGQLGRCISVRGLQ